MDLGCYGLHALRTLIGAEPTIMAAQSRWERGVDAATTARLRFAGGVEAELATSMDPAQPFTEILLEGTDGNLRINGFVQPQRAGRLRLTVGGRCRERPVGGPSSYSAQLDHVVGVLCGREAPVAR